MLLLSAVSKRSHAHHVTDEEGIDSARLAGGNVKVSNNIPPIVTRHYLSHSLYSDSVDK